MLLLSGVVEITKVEDRISSEKRPIYSYKLINEDCQE